MSAIRSFLFKLAAAAFVVLAMWVIYLDAQITATFSDKMWELPAKVYARPLELYAGATLSPDNLAYELEVLGYRRVDNPRSPGQVSRYRNRFDIHTRGFDFPGEREPARRVLVEFSGNRVKGLSAGGGAVDLMRLDPVQIGGIYPRHGEDRVLVKLQDVPATLRDGLLAVEDRNFYSHWGFSPSGIAGAALRNVRSRQVVAGGSTITQDRKSVV